MMKVVTSEPRFKRNKKLALIVGATTLVVTVPATAWVNYFHNSGTVNSGWDGTSVEHWGSIGDSNSAIYRGTSSIKATQVYDGGYTGRYHAEKVKRNGYQRGDSAFYGF